MGLVFTALGLAGLPILISNGLALVARRRFGIAIAALYKRLFALREKEAVRSCP